MRIHVYVHICIYIHLHLHIYLPNACMCLYMYMCIIQVDQLNISLENIFQYVVSLNILMYQTIFNLNSNSLSICHHHHKFIHWI